MSNSRELRRALSKNRERLLSVGASKRMVVLGTDTGDSKIEVIPELKWGYTKMLGGYDTQYTRAGISLLLEGGGFGIRLFADEQSQTADRLRYSELGLAVIFGR